MQYLREQSASVNVCLEREAGSGTGMDCSPQPAQLHRRDRRELCSQTGAPGKQQSRLKIPLGVRHSDPVGGVTTHTDQFEQLCWGKRWVYLLFNKTTRLALRQEKDGTGVGSREQGEGENPLQGHLYCRDGRLKRTSLLLLMAKSCCSSGKSLRNGSGSSAAIPGADSHLSEMQ